MSIPIHHFQTDRKTPTSDLLQSFLPTACLKHRSSDLEGRVLLRYKQHLWSRRPSEDEDERLPYEHLPHLSYPQSNQARPVQNWYYTQQHLKVYVKKVVLSQIQSEDVLFMHYLLLKFQSRWRHFQICGVEDRNHENDDPQGSTFEQFLTAMQMVHSRTCRHHLSHKHSISFSYFTKLYFPECFQHDQTHATTFKI